MKRTEIYKKIKEYNLQDVVKQTCGKNYTQVDNDMLLSIIEKSKKPAPKEQNEKRYSNGFNRLIEILKKKHLLLDSEVDYIYNS